MCIDCGAAMGDMHRGKCNPDNREGYGWMVLFEDTFLEFEPLPNAHLDDMGD